ncbi:hypothetical protein J3E74DRAFT_227998, partial [Bipolaris maydis]
LIRLDVYHSLHYLNMIRIMLNPILYNISNKENPYYIENQEKAKILNNPIYMRTHLEHCLDRIRQTIICHGNLAPSRLYT